MIQLISENCVGCGKCQKFCPMGVIAIHEKKAHIKEGFECIDCGHCQAMCDFDAIELNAISTHLPPAKRNVDYSDLKELIMSNRSIRFFKDELISNESIEDILRTLDYTSSAKNDQEVRWIVVTGKEKIKEIYQICLKQLKKADANHPLFAYIENVRNAITLDAPHLLIAYSDKSASKPLDDCVLKTTLATLLMHSKGIGSCFLGFLAGFINTNSALKASLGIQKEQRVYAILGFGYNNNEVYKKLPARKKAPINFIS